MLPIYFPISGLKGHGQAELIMLGSLLHTAIDKGMDNGVCKTYFVQSVSEIMSTMLCKLAILALVPLALASQNQYLRKYLFDHYDKLVKQILS